jgi:hypothetical protein
MSGRQVDRASVPAPVQTVQKESPKMSVPAKPSRRGRGAVALLAATLMLLAGALAAPVASADFGVAQFDFTATNKDGTPATQAGSHPYAIRNSFVVNFSETAPFFWQPDGGDIKNLTVEQVAGLVGDVHALPNCSTLDFFTFNPDTFESDCRPDTAIGITAPRVFEPSIWSQFPAYSLEPPPGVVVRLGFRVLAAPVVIDIGVTQEGEYNVAGTLRQVPQPLTTFGGDLELWGNPADPGHDKFRGECLPGPGDGAFGFTPPGQPIPFIEGTTGCPVSEEHPKKPFITLPRSCTGPAVTTHRAESWAEPGKWVEGSVLTHDNSIPPQPQGFTGCGKLPFEPTIEGRATTKAAETGSGLEFNIDFADEGLTNPEGLAQSEINKLVGTLPEGMTINPSLGEGLGACSPADLDRETISSKPGEGCPNSSKIGTVRAESKLVDGAVEGSIFLAQQDDPATTTPGAENPFDSLIALYLVVRNPELGILVKLPGRVEPDPKTGQLVAIAEDVPQLPVSHFEVRLREGQRAGLVTPPTCGTHTSVIKAYPWSDPDSPRTILSSFKVTEGIGGGPCPPGGVPPFHPGFEAGSINNDAKAFSPFYMRLLRADGEQDMTKFSSILPPGVLGKLAGVGKCSDAAVEAAKAKTGREELASPSCPANSQIGRSLAGAGVGGALTYVGGQIYLGGPYKGSPLSVISVTPAVAGPFDAGTVVVRLGLDLNPITAEVEVDGANSDPIPHILKGIPLKLRDLRVYVDRENFIINPTSCDPSSAKARLFGGFLDVFSSADDVPVDLATRYQAANCLNLGFKPHLKLNLKGGTKRGDHPGLKAVLRARPGDANIGAASVTLPRSAFLDQAHIRTICTRVQYAKDECPPGSIYGHAKAITPLLDEPIEGPVILRSSDNKLPDMIVALKGLVDVDVSSRIDSKNGGIRNTFDVVPDAPVTSFTLTLQGGKKGLIVNSSNLCAGKTSRAKARFVGQNGKVANLRPRLAPQCGGKRGRR